MKTKLTIIFLSLFFLQNLSAQIDSRVVREVVSEYDSLSTDYWIKSNIEFEYNSNGNISSEIVKQYDIDGERILWNGTFYSYDNHNNLLKKTSRKYNDEVGLWLTNHWEEHAYNSNGCETDYAFIINSGILSGEFQRIKYERNEDCQISKATTFRREFLLSNEEVKLYHIEERVYLHDNISYHAQFFAPIDTVGGLLLTSTAEYNFNTLGNIKESFSFQIANINLNYHFNQTKNVYEYDEHDNIVSHLRYNRANDNVDWKLSYVFHYENKYDNQDRVTKIKKTETQYTVNQTYEVYENGSTENYQYLCNELEKSKIVFVNFDEHTDKHDYFYEGKDECFEIADELLEVSIFPNPSLGSVTLTSPIFQSGDTQIMVFDMNGKLLLEKKEIKRNENTSLNLEALPNGMYVIQLMNQEHFIQDKIVISN